MPGALGYRTSFTEYNHLLYVTRMVGTAKTFFRDTATWIFLPRSNVVAFQHRSHSLARVWWHLRNPLLLAAAEVCLVLIKENRRLLFKNQTVAYCSGKCQCIVWSNDYFSPLLAKPGLQVHHEKLVSLCASEHPETTFQSVSKKEPPF